MFEGTTKYKRFLKKNKIDETWPATVKKGLCEKKKFDDKHVDIDMVSYELKYIFYVDIKQNKYLTRAKKIYERIMSCAVDLYFLKTSKIDVGKLREIFRWKWLIGKFSNSFLSADLSDRKSSD